MKNKFIFSFILVLLFLLIMRFISNYPKINQSIKNVLSEPNEITFEECIKDRTKDKKCTKIISDVLNEVKINEDKNK